MRLGYTTDADGPATAAARAVSPTCLAHLGGATRGGWQHVYMCATVTDDKDDEIGV